jgi:hypothetical protein
MKWVLFDLFGQKRWKFLEVLDHYGKPIYMGPCGLNKSHEQNAYKPKDLTWPHWYHVLSLYPWPYGKFLVTRWQKRKTIKARFTDGSVPYVGMGPKLTVPVIMAPLKGRPDHWGKNPLSGLYSACKKGRSGLRPCIDPWNGQQLATLSKTMQEVIYIWFHLTLPYMCNYKIETVCVIMLKIWVVFIFFPVFS